MRSKLALTSFTFCALFMYFVALSVELHDALGPKESENLGYSGTILEVGTLVDHRNQPKPWSDALTELCDQENISFVYQKQRDTGIFAVHDPDGRFTAISGSSRSAIAESTSWAAAQENENFSPAEIIEHVLPGFEGVIYAPVPANYTFEYEQALLYVSPDQHVPDHGIYYFASPQFLDEDFTDTFVTRLYDYGADIVHSNIRPGRDAPVERAKVWWSPLGKIAVVLFAAVVLFTTIAVINWLIKGELDRLYVAAVQGASQRDLRRLVLRTLANPLIIGAILATCITLIATFALRRFETSSIEQILFAGGRGMFFGMLVLSPAIAILVHTASRRVSRGIAT